MNWHPRVRTQSGNRVAAVLRRQANWRWLPAVVIFLFAPMAGAQNFADDKVDVSPATVQSGSLLLKMKSGYVVATQLNTDISAQVNGLAARVTVSQSFRNSGADWVEGIYVFPLPDAAAVDRLRMHIGERFIEGEVREKAAAKKAYQAAQAAGKKASLVEQERANLFTTSVANIAPGETVTIEIEYLETLHIDEGSFSIRFPVTMTPRYIPGTTLPGRRGSGWSADTTLVSDAARITPPVVTRSTHHKLGFSAQLNVGMPLEFISSRYHPVDIRRTDDRYAIDLLAPTAPMDHDIELTWRPAAETLPRATLFSETLENDEHYALLMLLPPDDARAEQQSADRELLLVIDTSGSMHGTSLDQAKRALALALDGLRPTDQFNVLQFNSVTSSLFQRSVVATTTNIATAKRYVAALTANGGTEMHAAIELALSTPVSETHLRQVIFVTDGSVGNEEGLFRLIENRLGAARLFTVGIGSAPNSWFMRKAAEVGRGSFTLISALHEVTEKMSRLFRKIEQPQVTDITVQWPGGLAAETYPSSVPDLYAGEPVFVRAKLGGAPLESGLVTVRGTSAAGGWSAELPVNSSETSAGIGALWARAKIEDLHDRQRRGAAAADTRAAVLATALAHHLVSRYTSLVAIDKTPVRPINMALTKEQVPTLLPYGQSPAKIFGFPATATGAGAYRLNGAILIAIAALGLLLMRRRSRHVRTIVQQA